MQFVHILLIAFCACVIDARPKKEWPPAFCKGRDCPVYHVVKKGNETTKNYELRCYNNSYWADTTMKSSWSRSAFWRLFRYIEGDNKEEVKISMTVPVVVQMQLSEDRRNVIKRNMSFYIPYKYQDNPVPPTNPSVRISLVKSFCAYVRVYGGFSYRPAMMKNFRALEKDLDDDGLSHDYNRDMFFTAGYDSPWTFFDRHNEIWVIQKAQKKQNAEVIEAVSSSKKPKKRLEILGVETL